MFISLALACLSCAAWGQQCTYNGSGQTDSCQRTAVLAVPPLASPQGGAVVSTYDPNSFYSCAGAFSPTALSASAVPSSGGAGNVITIKNPAGSGKIDRLYTVAFSPQSTTATMVTVWYAFFSGAPTGGSPATVTPGAYDPVVSSAASAVCNTYAGTGQIDGTLLNLILDESGDTSLLTAAVGGPGTYALSQGGGPIVLHPGYYVSVNLTGASLPSGIVVKYALYFSEGAE